MQPNDIIILNVTGTNGTTRNQKTISRRFNGQGQPLDDNGKVVESPEILRNLPNGSVSKAPDFPMTQFLAAQAKGAEGADELNQILIAHAEQTKTWQDGLGGGDEKLQIAKSALGYAKEFHDFREDDGDWFVMKLENLAVNVSTLPDKRTLYTVTGTAIFG